MTVAGPEITPSLPPQNTAPTTNKNDEPLTTAAAVQSSSTFLWSPSSDNNNTESSSSSDVVIDPRFVLPKCELPPAHEFKPVETFVATAVLEQHQQKDDNDVPFAVTTKNYKAILEALRFKSDLSLLTKILLAMRTSRNTMHLLTTSSTTTNNSGASNSSSSNNNKHARLIHQIFRFNPFQQTTTTTTTTTTPSKTVVSCTAAEAEEDVTKININMGLVDAHLSLVVALVSANSVFLVPATTALWKLLNSDIHIAPDERHVF